MIIEVDGLAKSFKEIEAVKGVTFGVEAGRDLRLPARTGGQDHDHQHAVHPAEPQCRVGTGQRLRRATRAERGPPLDQPGLPVSPLDEYLSAEQNLRFHAHAYGIPSELREQRMTELLNIVDLADWRKAESGPSLAA